MAGIRIGGTTILVPPCSPPFGAGEGSAGDGDFNVYRACANDVAGEATKYTDFNDAGTTDDGISNPVLSPDGTQILFELANPNTGFTEIWVVDNTPGSTGTQLLADGSNYWLYPSWHPDSDQFVCVHGSSGSFSGDLVATSVSDPGTTTVLKSASGSGIGQRSPLRPQYNFDGSRIAYNWANIVFSSGELRVMDDDGSNDAQLDSTVSYRFTGPQFGWANGQDTLAYDNGGSTNAAYVINGDGTGKTQINANGDAAGLTCWVSDRCWPDDDSYVVLAATSGSFGGQEAMRAELDGSDTTSLNTSHGSWAANYFRQVLVANGRVWFIESTSVLASFLLDGSDYRVDLTIDGVAMDGFANGDGWFYV